MNIEKAIEQQQERNREYLQTYDNYNNTRTYKAVPEEDLDQLTTDTFKQGMLAVIGEIKKQYDYYGNANEVVEVRDLLHDLSTLEKQLQYNK